MNPVKPAKKAQPSAGRVKALLVAVALSGCLGEPLPGAEALPDAGPSACERVTSAIGPEGGTVSLCGASLEVPAGALTESTNFSVEHVLSPSQPPWFDHEFAGPAIRFDSDRPIPQPSKVHIALPFTAREGQRVYLAQAVEGDWSGLEPCPRSGALGQWVRQLGVYVVLRSTDAYVGNRVGQGIIHTELSGERRDYDIPGSVGFARYQLGADGTQSVDLLATHERFERLRLSLSAPPNGPGTLVLVDRLCFGSASCPPYNDVAGNAGVAVDLSRGDSTLSGSFEVTVFVEGRSEILKVSFTVTPVKWAPPSSTYCPGPDSGDGV